jgi:hypothetical protein
VRAAFNAIARGVGHATAQTGSLAVASNSSFVTMGVMQKLRIVYPTLLVSSLASLVACGSSTPAPDADAGPPVVSDVTPTVTMDADGVDFDVSLVVDFTGDNVTDYTFDTTNLTAGSGEVDDTDVTLAGATTSPVTISGIVITAADDGGDTSVDCQLGLFDGTDEGTLFDFTLTITANAKFNMKAGATQHATAPAKLRH